MHSLCEIYRRRMSMRTVGTAQITPPLPEIKSPVLYRAFLCPPSTHAMSALLSKPGIRLVLVFMTANDTMQLFEE